VVRYVAKQTRVQLSKGALLNLGKGSSADFLFTVISRKVPTIKIKPPIMKKVLTVRYGL